MRAHTLQGTVIVSWSVLVVILELALDRVAKNVPQPPLLLVPVNLR